MKNDFTIFMIVMCIILFPLMAWIGSGEHPGVNFLLMLVAFILGYWFRISIEQGDKRRCKMKQTNNKKLVKQLDGLLPKFNIMRLVWSTVWLMIFSTLFSLLFIGLTSQALEGYFEYVVVAVLFVFCLREAIEYMQRLPNLFIVPGVGIFLNSVLLMTGNDPYLLTISIVLMFGLSIATILYQFILRDKLLKKEKQ